MLGAVALYSTLTLHAAGQLLRLVMHWSLLQRCFKGGPDWGRGRCCGGIGVGVILGRCGVAAARVAVGAVAGVRCQCAP